MERTPGIVATWYHRISRHCNSLHWNENPATQQWPVLSIDRTGTSPGNNKSFSQETPPICSLNLVARKVSAGKDADAHKLVSDQAPDAL